MSLLELLSKNAQSHLSGVTVNELMSEQFINSSQHLTQEDKFKLNLIRESYGKYTVTKMVKERITSTEKAGMLAMKLIGGRSQEVVILLTLNTKNEVINIHEVYKGTLNSCYLEPRDIFRHAIKDNAARVIMAHNHPSGDCEPSGSDIHVTKKIIKSGNLIGIELLDHLIVSTSGFVSLKSDYETECGFY